MALGALVLRVAANSERRRIFETADGLRLYLDPLSHVGRTVLDFGRLEDDTETRLRDLLKPGHTFVDVGANEGVMSAVAASLVGRDGFVLAIEPQERLRDIAEINIRLNGPTEFAVISSALGGDAGTSADMRLYPALNTGASGFVKKYRFSRRRQAVNFVSLESLLADYGQQSVDLIKVDVEGYEGKVVDAIIPLIQAGCIRRALIDYHTPFLQTIGDSPQRIHRALLEAGMHSTSEATSGWGLYEHRSLTGDSR